ncbi:MAG: BREX system ATP-binding domain-containing protein, partial [Candidatus Paceibacterota bacterium]
MTNEDKFIKERYGLKNQNEALNTFKIRAAREKQLEWWIDREQELKIWRNIIKESVSLNKNFIVLIIGSYGRGKTLALYKVVDEAEKHKEIYPVFLNFKGEEKSKPGLDFIFRIFKNINFSELIKNRTDKDLRNAIGSIPQDFEEAKNILERIVFDEPSNSSPNLFPRKTKSQKTKVRSEINKLALFFLRGEIRPNASQLKQLGVIRKIENTDIAKEYLSAILYFVKNLGYKALLLAIDEFEYLFSLVSKSQQSIYVALLRSLYDFPPGRSVETEDIANMVYFIAISEDGWNSLKEMERKET